MPASKDSTPAQAGDSGTAAPRPFPFWFPILAGLVHAGLIFIAFPPIGFWPAALIAPIPLVWAIVRSGWAPWRLALLVSLGILPLNLYEQHWVIEVSGAGYVPLAVIMSWFSGLFLWIAARAHRRFPGLSMTVLVPVVWTGVEAFRGEAFFTGYPWLLLAHPLIDAPILPIAAGLIGTYGVSFLAAGLTGITADVLWTQRVRPAVAGGVVIVLVYAAAWVARPPSEKDPGSLRIAVIQTNLPQDNKNEWTTKQRAEDFARFAALTQEAAAVRPVPDLIVWPETMYPGIFLDLLHIFDDHGQPIQVQANEFVQALLDLQFAARVPLMIGALGADNLRLDTSGNQPRTAFDSLYNSVFLVRDGRVQPGRYDKLELVPFGEVMPYIHYWPWLQQKMLDLVGPKGMAFDLSPGFAPVLFRVPTADGKHEAAIATPICFEATKPALCRRLLGAAGESPAILVNLTNDGWFGGFDGARWQHMQISRWRAVELNTPVIRAANTGVSAAIDARGRVLKAGVDGSSKRTQVDGVLTADILLGGPRTIYARTGDVLGWSALIATGLLLAATFRKPAKEAA